MTKLAIATLVAGGLTAATAGLTGTAVAAPAEPGTADTVISQLQRDGYRVIVNRIGTAPLNRATVVAIRPGQTYSRTDSGVAGAGDDIVTTVTGRTVYVDVR
ncbi:hypothetical protein [Mycolicibacterium thermoresistibile]|jgi:hypothetical protein|uniref:PASTA domain-containing protein n=2 Tax=Mycolicibacterium thermoresistibile TaxID=1797 RepID=G7CIV3_MYCT3|nr:hypothetical protein [Mycolicibacterium thermoresistibile]EHI12632.1 hypothetical protein KEK_17073 [Mycolicibacterium thermoresistibile ATCC 19527]MCV7190107.1 hypothetical protein [Mycolicibacterium thermoresistibile]GAT13836.1 putative uncharacterized protein [Mycolicibacterium thermoresistibile]SNW19009.1 Uncharacterised protein [Mycolicibacterium thermoresistibile]